MSETDVLGEHERRVVRFRVRVLDGPNAGRTRDSSGVELTIGKAEGNDLVLADPTVSRHHCVLKVTADGIELIDLGSTNGTTLGGHRIRAAFVDRGSEIGVGASTLAFEPLDRDLVETLSASDRFGPLIGTSDPMRRIFAIAARVARSEVNVLIEGETGTGKTLLAEAIHEDGPRKGGPFVVIDCGAIPAALMENELFGHEKGAFTGADARQAGLFEAASGGTVFLDEIGELPLELQPRLLRVLEAREVRRVGSQTPIPIDVRVIAATNRDLRRAVNQGDFRSDLWFRLATVRIEVPPLRDHRADLPLLARAFYRDIVGDAEAEPPGDLMDALPRSDWPGNIRELRGAVERAVLLGSEAETGPGGTAPDQGARAFDPSLSFRDAKSRATDHWERRYLIELMQRENGNISRAARTARMDRSHLRSLLGRHRIELPRDGS